MKLVKAGSLLPLLLSGRALVAPRPLTRAPSCRTIGRASPPRMAVIDPSFNLALGSLALGSAFGVKGSPVKFAPAALLLAAFGAFVAFQTATLRFEFTDAGAFELAKAGQAPDENVVTGGSNSWKLKTVTNYAFLPSEEFPILVYFRETQTPVANRVEAPIVVDNLDGQAHFFPAIARSDQIAAGFAQAGCPRQ
mmetsp:Transcript_23309/g.72012  ORF Transcript_23309/g.72012 Transcript_23309/m.72012 type:complete len:194 (-) Transcript_23309:29-610(-)